MEPERRRRRTDAFENRARNGNHLTREEGSTLALAAAGTLSFPDGEEVVLTTCEGAGGENSVSQTLRARAST